MTSWSLTASTWVRIVGGGKAALNRRGQEAARTIARLAIVVGLVLMGLAGVLRIEPAGAAPAAADS